MLFGCGRMGEYGMEVMHGVKGVGDQLITVVVVQISQRIHHILNVKFTGTVL
jgi:hypothetical protein